MTDSAAAESRARPAEIIFEVTEAVEGGYDARALGYSIYTQGQDWDDLQQMARDAVLCAGSPVTTEIRVRILALEKKSKGLLAEIPGVGDQRERTA